MNSKFFQGMRAYLSALIILVISHFLSCIWGRGGGYGNRTGEDGLGLYITCLSWFCLIPSSAGD